MNLLNKYTSFSIIVILLAIMDGFNFYWPHNDGFFSLTYGPGSSSWDAWHVCKRLIFAVIFIDCFGFKPKSYTWWFKGGIFALIAWMGQYIIYDVLIK